MLASLVAGVELECRLGAMLGEGHYSVGFHSTGTVGTFGSAAACAHLLALPEEKWLTAMGLAGTQAAGLKSVFGTMGKPLHAGKAATTGLLAALLAREGFSAPPDILEAPQGFAETHAGEEPSAEMVEKYAGRFLICDTLFKYHASCYLTHAAIEAARTIREDQRMTPSSIESVSVHVSPALLKVCNIEAPVTGLEGKFSLRTTTALALLGEDTGDLATFSDAKMAEPEVAALRDRVLVIPTDGMSSTQARVCVDADGRTVERETDSGVPLRDLPAQRDRLRDKFKALAEPVVGPSQAVQLADAALAVDEADSVDELLQLARPAGSLAGLS